MDSVDNNNSSSSSSSNNNNNNNNNNNKGEKTKRSFNPFRKDNTKSVSFSSSPLKQQDAVVSENNSNSIDNSLNNNSNNSSENIKDIPTLTRQDSNSSINSISSTYSTSSVSSNVNNNNNSAMNRPRSKSEKKDKLTFNTLISKASRKSMRIVIGNNNNNNNNNNVQNIEIIPESANNINNSSINNNNNSQNINLNSSTNSISSSVSNDEYFKNLSMSTSNANGSLSVQDKKKNRGSIFVRLLSRKNKDDPISEEDWKIESSQQTNGGSLPPLPPQHQHHHHQQQQFSSTPNLLAQSHSFNGKDNNGNCQNTIQNHPSHHSTTNLLNHHHQNNDGSTLAQSMVTSTSTTNLCSNKKELDREETIKKIQMMANELNETVKLPSSTSTTSTTSKHHHHNISSNSGSITPPRFDRQSSDQSFLSSYTTPISTTPLSNHNKSNPFDQSQHHHNTSGNEELETDYSIDSNANIETSSTTSSVANINHVIVPSTSSTSLSVSSSSAFSPPSPIVHGQPNTLNNSSNNNSSNKHKRYTVAIPKWDASMNFYGNPFERLVQVLRNSTDANVVNNDYEEQLIQQQLNQLLIEEQQHQQSSLSSSMINNNNRNSIQLESPRSKSLPQSVLDGIEEEKQKRSILLLCLSKLIKKLISEPNDDSILFKSFFTTYDCIYSSKDILNELSSLFKTESPQIQLRICNIIKFWLKDYYISQLCDYNFASEFKDFIIEIKDIQDSYLYSKIIDLRNQLIYLLETKITERCLDTTSSGISSVSKSSNSDDNGENIDSNVNNNNSNSNDSIDNNSPELIEKRYLNKKSTLKIKTFLSTSLKSCGFDFNDFQQQPPSPPSSPTHRRFSPQTTSNGYMDGGVLSYSSLEQNNGQYENEYDTPRGSSAHHRRQSSISSSNSTSFSLSSSTSSASHKKHNRSISSNSNNGGTTNTTTPSTNQPVSIAASNSLSFNLPSPSSASSNTFWVQTRPRSSTWSSSDIFLSIMDAPAKEIAKSLTAIDFSIFLCIETQELMNGAWGKQHLKDKAPNIIKLISRFNEISMNVIQTILNEEKLKDRCKVMARFIKIAKNLHELRNYNSLMAIYAGISHSSITRLKWTKKILPKTHQKTLQDLEKLMESDENFKNYRTELKTITTSPCIPFLGLILSDMTFIQEGNPDFLGTDNDSWQLNINKLKLMYNCIKQIQNFQKTAYLLNADPRLTLILTPNSNIFGEPQPLNYNYQQSSQTVHHQQQTLQSHQPTTTIQVNQQQQQQQQQQLQQPIVQQKQSIKIENNSNESLSPRSQIESITNNNSNGTNKPVEQPKQKEEPIKEKEDLNKIFSIPPFQNNKPLVEKKNSQHDLLFRSFTLEDSITPVRKYSFNTWSSPKKVNFDIFNSSSSIPISSNSTIHSDTTTGKENPLKMERSQSEKYLPLNKMVSIQFNINHLNLTQQEKNNSLSPRENENNENVKLTSITTGLTLPLKDINGDNDNNSYNNIDSSITCGGSNTSNSSTVPSPSLSRPNNNGINNGGNSSTSPSGSPIVSPQQSQQPVIIAPIEQDNSQQYRLNKSCDDNNNNNIDNESFNLNDGNCQIAEELVFSIKGQTFTKNRRKSVSTSNIHNISPLSATNNSLLKPNLQGPRSANNSPHNGNSGNVSPQNGQSTVNNNGNSINIISTVGSQSLFKRKSFDQHFIPRPAHSFVPMTDESLFSLSLKLEPRGVKLSDLA